MKILYILDIKNNTVVSISGITSSVVKQAMQAMHLMHPLSYSKHLSLHFQPGLAAEPVKLKSPNPCEAGVLLVLLPTPAPTPTLPRRDGISDRLPPLRGLLSALRLLRLLPGLNRTGPDCADELVTVWLCG